MHCALTGHRQQVRGPGSARHDLQGLAELYFGENVRAREHMLRSSARRKPGSVDDVAREVGERVQERSVDDGAREVRAWIEGMKEKTTRVRRYCITPVCAGGGRPNLFAFKCRHPSSNRRVFAVRRPKMWHGGNGSDRLRESAIWWFVSSKVRVKVRVRVSQ